MNLYDTYDAMLEDIFYKYIFYKVNIERAYNITMSYIDVGEDE